MRVDQWHRYKMGYHQEMICFECGTKKPFPELSIGWWKRFRAKIKRTEHLCPTCGERIMGEDTSQYDKIATPVRNKILLYGREQGAKWTPQSEAVFDRYLSEFALEIAKATLGKAGIKIKDIVNGV